MNPNRKQLIGILIYSLVFPLSNLVGGSIMLAGIFLTLPALPLAWIGGMSIVWLFGNENLYLIGAGMTILLQSYFAIAIWNWYRTRMRDENRT